MSKRIPNLPEARTDTLELICKWCADKPEVYSTYSVQATFWAISVQPNANYQSLEILLNLVENKIRESKKANPNTMTGVYAQRIRWAIWNHPTYLTTKAREAELGDLPVDWLASLLLPKDLTAPQNIFKMREWRV